MAYKHYGRWSISNCYMGNIGYVTTNGYIFPLFTILEDLGFLPRIAFNLDRCLNVHAHLVSRLLQCVWDLVVMLQLLLEQE